jgi:hypothetical protein
MTIALLPFGRSLISRQRGALVRDAILAEMRPDECLVLDFSGVRRASYSFVDELYGKLLSTRGDGGRASVAIINAGETVAFHASECARRRLGLAEATA